MMGNNLPFWVVILLTTIPALASITVAYISNRRSQKAEALALANSEKIVTRQEIELILKSYKELADIKDKTIDQLKVEVDHLDQVVTKLRAEMDLEQTKNKKLEEQVEALREQVEKMKRIIALSKKIGKNVKHEGEVTPNE